MNRIDHFAPNPDDKHIDVDFVGRFQRGSDAVALQVNRIAGSIFVFVALFSRVILGLLILFLGF